MRLDKKSLSILLAVALFLGGIGAASLRAHAQKNVVQTPVLKTGPYQSMENNQKDSVIDKDNVQYGDASDEKMEASDKNNSDQADKTGNENLLDKGHQDKSGENIDHQFDGVE